MDFTSRLTPCLVTLSRTYQNNRSPLCIAVYIYIYIYRERERYNCMYVCVYIYIYVCICLCVCVYTCVYIYLYIYIYILPGGGHFVRKFTPTRFTEPPFDYLSLQSYISKGIWRQGNRLLCKEFLCFNTYTLSSCALSCALLITEGLLPGGGLDT